MNRWVIPFLIILFLVGCAPTIVQNTASMVGQSQNRAAEPIAPVVPADSAAESDSTVTPAQPVPAVPELPAFDIPESAKKETSGDNPVVPMAPPEDIALAAQSNNAFALDLLGILRADTPNANIIYSPISIYTAFSMLYAGAEGETATQLADVLKFDLDPAQLHPAVGALATMITGQGQDGFTLTIANALWGREGQSFTLPFLDTLSRYYGATVQWLDFANNPQGAADAVNQWVSDATNGKIPTIVQEFAPDTALVLANAIYFNAGWVIPFEENGTRPAPFVALDGTTQEVPKMQVTADFAYAEGGNYQVVALPYAGGTARMVVILPADGEFAAFEENLTGEQLAVILDDLNRTPRQVALTMPKFEYETTTDLVDVLGKLGLTLPFTSRANLSGINGIGGLGVDQAIHKAKITVDEQGTEAAAATVIGVVTLSMPLDVEPVTMTVDRPFMYFIQDTETNALLFVGRIVNFKS
jgi:serpin B